MNQEQGLEKHVRRIKLKCYRSNCKEECNELKIQYCLFRITKRQQRIIAQIKGMNCINCENEWIEGNYKGEEVRLCTSCGIIANDMHAIKRCLINSRRAG